MKRNAKGLIDGRMQPRSRLPSSRSGIFNRAAWRRANGWGRLAEFRLWHYRKNSGTELLPERL